MQVKRILLAGLLAAIVFVFGSGVIVGVCPDPLPEPYDPNKVPFDYDPNIVAYKLLGSVQVRQGSPVHVELSACDPDDDPVVISLFDGPAGAAVTKDGETYFLNWVPGQLNLGVYTVNIQASDRPEFDESLSDYGSILIKVYAENRPPVLLPCCGG